MKTSLKRILRAGLLSFQRNKGLSLITAFVMFLTISLLTSLFLFKGTADFIMVSLEKKIDISVYFKEDSSEDDILRVKDSLAALQGVKEVDYVSREQALADFKERHQNDEPVTQALNEVGDNPFLASLNITANDALKYENVSQFLGDVKFERLISKVDYFQRKPVIERFYSLKSGFEKTGLVLVLVLAFIASAITFVTIRLAIYSSSDEIGVMRLVGASNWFIRGPFIIQGVICGLLACLAVFLLFLALSYAISDQVFDLTGGFNLFKYFMGNVFSIIGLELLVGVGLGTVSSLVAVGKYLDK